MKKTNKFWTLFDYIFPKYTRFPLVFLIFANTLAYYGTRLLAPFLTHYSPALPIDDLIPYIPSFISIYIISYAQWVVGYIITARESREVCYRFLYGEIAAKLMCAVIFLIYPTTMVRADISGGGFWNFFVGLIYSTDSPDHLFPSIHCLESWILFRASLKVKKLGRWYPIFSFVFAILVFASTVFVKQHCFIDIFGGIAVAELGLLVWGLLQKRFCRVRPTDNAEKGPNAIEQT